MDASQDEEVKEFFASLSSIQNDTTSIGVA